MNIVARIASLAPVLAVVAVVQALWSLPADGQSGRGVSRGEGSPEFDAANPEKTTSSDYKKNCLACHVPARDTDWVYVGGYPALK